LEAIKKEQQVKHQGWKLSIQLNFK
jgi:hypothetical protein